MDVAEEALREMVPQVVTLVAQKLGEQVVWDHREEIRRVVHDYIMDRKWAEPIIRQEIRNGVRAVLREMFTEAPTERN